VVSQKVIAESVPSQAEGEVLFPPALHMPIPRDPIGPRRGPTVICLNSVPAYSAGAELTIVRRPYDLPFSAGEPEGVAFVRLRSSRD
jgi:hypothetical protein